MRTSDKPAATARVRTPIVDQHATWIAVNPIQGCPKACAYCFLNERGQTSVKPEHLTSPPAALRLLMRSSYYEPSRPVALYTWTDVMALPASRSHLAEFLSEMLRCQLANPVVLITKCRVPDETINLIRSARESGLEVIVYLSYSGLGRDVERGIRHGELADNFPRLAAAGIPIVHYWRPAFPASASTPTMERVLDVAARYARCTVAAGLKVEPTALPRLSRLWPELSLADGVTDAEGVYPRPFWQFIHRTWRRHPSHPLFHTNSCALSYVLGRPDSFGIFGSDICRVRNHCPIAQRDRCHRADAEQVTPTPEHIREVLKRRGLDGVSFHLAESGHELTIDATVATNTTAALTHDLGIRVSAARDDADEYWSSGTVGALPLILG